MLTKWALPVALGFVGVGLGLIAVHLYYDHAALHAIIDLVNKSQPKP